MYFNISKMVSVNLIVFVLLDEKVHFSFFCSKLISNFNATISILGLSLRLILVIIIFLS